MTKKQHTHSPHMSRHVVSRLEKEARTRRIITIAASIFLAAVLIAVGIGLYVDKVKPMNEVVIEVNGRPFKMGYYVDFLELYSQSISDETQLLRLAQQLPSQIIRDEIIRQGAQAEGIVVTSDEIKNELEQNDLPNNDVYRDSAAASLYNDKLRERFRAALPATKVQVTFEIMLVESRDVADQVIPLVNSGSAVSDLLEQYSANPTITPLQDWVPPELLANADVKNFCETREPGSVSAFLDETATKQVGYWLIEVIDKDNTGAILPRTVLCGSAAEATEARQRLEAGEDWATIVAEYSQYTYTDEEGVLDFLTPEDIVSTAFNEAAFALELNTLSEPIRDTDVQTNGGYWVVKLLGREDREIATNISDALVSKEFNDWYTQKSEEAVVEQTLTIPQVQWAVARVSG
jgi:parvulin-like peptidyl-prolyl isomerase